MTQGIDIVVDNLQMTSQLESVLEAMETSDFVFEKDSIGAAIKTRGCFSCSTNRMSYPDLPITDDEIIEKAGKRSGGAVVTDPFQPPCVG